MAFFNAFKMLEKRDDKKKLKIFDNPG